MPDPRREELQALLESLCPNVYFQPGPNITMTYPCIVYERDQLEKWYANNKTYGAEKRYQVTVIDQEPDSDIPDQVAVLPKCEFQTHFAAENLNHDVYNLYF